MEVENMNIKEVSSIALPKWPAMIVAGNRVTDEQASEILIRTGGVYFSCNDSEFNSKINDLLFENCDKSMSCYEQSFYVAEKYNILPLEFLNNQQVASSFVCGTHGWCSWNGEIFTNNYNIGKWPNVIAIFEEWKLIAEAFPYLKLKCQLFSGENCEHDIVPLVEYCVEDGCVSMSYPSSDFGDPSHQNITFFDIIYSPKRGQGCTVEKFKEALKITLERKGKR